MRVLYVDAGAGAAGDMLLGALVDLGLPATELRRALGGLALAPWTLRARRLVRHGLAGRKIDVRVRGDEPPRGWRELQRIVSSAGLAPRVRQLSLDVFRRLIEAEAEAHGVDPESAHLHEAGGSDAIIDVVGFCFGVERLGVERVVVSPMTTGWGTVRCAHGEYPVPAPATLALVRGLPVRAGEAEVERLTPTGAALLTTLADAWGPLPPMIPEKIGYGAGDRELADGPNMVRLVLGRGLDDGSAWEGLLGEVAVIECNLDDVAPQTIAHAGERLLEAGALDVHTTATTMKKGRSGHVLTVLARPESLARVARAVIELTASLGLRFRLEQRFEVPRMQRSVRTPWGDVRVKIGQLGAGAVRAWPEYEDCAALARQHGLRLHDVQDAALRAYHADGSSSLGDVHRGPTRGSRRSDTGDRRTQRGRKTGTKRK